MGASFWGSVISWMRYCSFLLLLNHLSQAQLRPDACLKEYTAEEVVHAVQREHVCTLLVLAATWDGHYRSFASGGVWQALSKHACQDDTVEVGVYHYSGAPAGETGSIPMELGLGATLGSYSPRMFLGGRDFGELTEVRGASVTELVEEHGEDWLETLVLRPCRKLQAEAPSEL
eukprot:TRINITY_DN51681_c0_g1_i1.p1 TRINITY_DN51681_c0_g1~~TRINITY_DN51681_c0_g1_i1.p1  ORF type:complete len:174 (+),score=30.80 TRINITY_DN51681_c0_g1_i1:52-573(+)